MCKKKRERLFVWKVRTMRSHFCDAVNCEFVQEAILYVTDVSAL